MTNEREEQIKKDLLRDYTKAVSALEAFRVNFRSVADSLESIAKTLRDNPEDLADSDFDSFQQKFDTAIASAKEYRDMTYQNAERKASLMKMGVLR